jgi:uncharacterized surface protein with fasciclin (FAS1) repeats
MDGSNKATGWIIGIIAAVLVVGGLLIVMGSDDDTETTDTTTNTSQQTQPEEQAPELGDIVATAAATPTLSTLVTAVQQADLVATLQGDGPFTVLAPTNDAFDALPEGTLATLLEDENKDQLAGILTYHVIAGAVFSTDLSDGQVVETVNGEKLTVDITDAGVFFVDATGGRAQVAAPDVETSNGVVHVIDAVLLPQ